jgi:hypothetical protein
MAHKVEVLAPDAAIASRDDCARGRQLREIPLPTTQQIL